MTDHIADGEHTDLLGLLRGELTTTEALRVREHTVACLDCRDELLELAVGHSLLTASSRSLAAPSAVSLPEPPAAPAPSLPRRWRRIGLGLAAAVVLVAGAGVATVLLDDDPDQPPRSEPATATPLEGVGAVTGHGEVTMTGTDVTSMTVETTDLPRPREGHYYYVWLLDPQTNKMLPIGQISAEGSTTFRLPLSLLRRYSAIDVSLEADNGDPSHSVTSVLRADYRIPTGDLGS